MYFIRSKVIVNTKSALVIDDHPLVARGVAAFLESHCGFETVKVATSIELVWHYIDLAHPPSMIVLDFWLPEGASLKLLEKLKLQLPTTVILVLSGDDDPCLRDKVMLAGANGFLNKNESAELFMMAVNSLLSGESWFPDKYESKEFFNHNRELIVTAAELGLTARQGQILAMIMKGFPNKRIALNLSLSEQTVKEHVTGILSRLGVNNRVEAITKLRGRRLE